VETIIDTTLPVFDRDPEMKENNDTARSKEYDAALTKSQGILFGNLR
jgi:hypothetical protein